MNKKIKFDPLFKNDNDKKITISPIEESKESASEFYRKYKDNIDVEDNEEIEEVDLTIPHIDNRIIDPSKEIKINQLPDMNEAHDRNNNKNPSSAIITTACGEDDSRQVCFFKNDCPILNAYDKIIYERLEKNEVIALEVRWCHKYEPRYKYSNYDPNANN